MGRAKGSNRSFAAIVPEREQVLPNGAIVHWPEIYFTKMPYPAVWVPVTCPNPWGSGKCRGKRVVRVSRGLSKPEPLTTAVLAQEGCEFFGLCRECKKWENRPNQKVQETGSELLWQELNADGLPIVCGNCDSRWVLRYAAQVSRAGFTGHCRACANGMRRGDEEHPSGTIIHWDNRHPEHISLIAITCHGCKNEDGKDRYAWHAEVTDDAWPGLCRDCSSLRPPHNKYLHDEELTLSKSVIHWGERDPQNSQRVMVSCGLCRRAGKTTKRLMNVSAYRSWKKNKRAGHCKDHYTDPDALIALLQGDTQSSNGQADKKSVRRAQKLSEVVSAIIAVWQDVRNPNLPREEQIELITQWRVARKLGIGDEADSMSAANQVGERLRRLEVRRLFPNAQSPYRGLVESVIDKAECGISPDDIAQELLKGAT